MTRFVRTVLTFVLLTAGYFGYERGYAVLSARVTPPFESSIDEMQLKPSQSASAQQADELALKNFGAHHWTSGTVSDVTRYYNVERGYWMYWSALEFPEEHDRKRIELSPFAVIWASEKDGSTKILTGDRAIIDFDQPFQPFGGGGQASVVHAKVEGIEEQVLILDDKGTPDSNDDLVVTAPYFEYFEKQSQLRCDDFVQMIDGDVSVDGKELVISLRPAESSGGFPGAEVVTLNDVKIVSEDIGGSGFVPGTATPDQQVSDDSGALKTPGILSAGSMRMQLPKPKLPAPVGPPAPTAPTIAEFSRNVVIERGREAPDRITGDHLYAILVPKDAPPPPPVEGGADEASEDPGSGGLRLLEARVDGHVVWLESQSEHLRVRGNELIYRKPDDATPEVSYFRADPGQQIEFERMEVDERGNPTSFVTVFSADATLRGDPEGKGRSTVVTRGPVLLEMRSRKDGPVERSASCRGEMIIETSLSAAEGEDSETRTFITLEGWPIMHDPGQLTLASREKIEVSLMPQDDGMPVESTETGGRGRSYQIEWLSALGDVHMVTPEGVDGPAGMAATADGKSGEGRRELNARERLDVVFSYLNEVIDPNAPMADAGPARVEGAGQTRFASQVREGTSAPEGPNPAAPGDSTGVDVAASPAKGEEPSPPFSAEADVVWARIEVTGGGPGIDLTGGGGGTREVREARFRRDVVIHQDPAPGKEAGFHVDADYGIDLQNVGPGRLKLFAHGEARPVTIASDDVFIQGFPDPKADGKVVVGVDQAYDYAFIQGPGRLWNLSDSTGMGRLELANDRREEAPDKGREPLIVTWSEAMFFHGRFAEPDGTPGPARALFLGDVKSRNGDAGSASQEMEAIFDRGVSFDRALPGGTKEPGAVGSEDRERLEIAAIICNGQVELWSIARDDSDVTIPVADRQVLELRQAFGDSLTFDRIGDRFWMEDQGTVSVATLDTGKPNASSPANLGRGVIPTTYQPDAPQRAVRPKLSKFRVDFNDGLEGQLGTVGGGYRVAEFRGDARAIRAGVAQFQDILDFDRPPSDAVLLEGDVITVEQFPEMAGVPERNFMKAFGGAQARADGKTLLGDTITYDSTSENFFVKATDEAPVTIASQEAFGQPTSRSTAKSIRYNTKTEDVEIMNPGSGMFFRPETGYRLGNMQPKQEKPKPERERPTGRLPNRSDMERQGFTGN